MNRYTVSCEVCIRSQRRPSLGSFLFFSHSPLMSEHHFFLPLGAVWLCNCFPSGSSSSVKLSAFSVALFACVDVSECVPNGAKHLFQRQPRDSARSFPSLFIFSVLCLTEHLPFNSLENKDNLICNCQIRWQTDPQWKRPD